VAILQTAEKGDKPVTQLCKEKGIAEATFHTWRKRFGAMATRDAHRLRGELEKENARLKPLLAQRDPELDVVKSEASVARREALSKNF
jgi:putative transposase